MTSPGATVDRGGGRRARRSSRSGPDRRPLHRERRTVHAANFRAWPFWLGSAGWLVYFAAPVVPGWLIAAILDEYQHHRATGRAAALVVVLAAAELAIAWGIAVVHPVYTKGFEASKALIRSNVLDAQLASGGPRAASRNVAVGDALVRLRDDPMDMIFLLDNWIDLVGAVAFGAAAGVLLVRIDPLAAFVGIAPLLALGLANRSIATVARHRRAVARAAASEVSGFLAAAFEASLTVKVMGAQDAVLRRLDQLNATRSRASVRDGVWHGFLRSLNTTLADVLIGIALVVAARGPLTAGDVTLFFSYLVLMTALPMRIGGIVAGRRRFEVSEARLDALVGRASDGGPTSGASDDPLVADRPMPVLGGPAAPPPVRPPRSRLQRLEVVGLTSAARRLVDVDLVVERGELVVVRGPVGAGKSSLLRAVIGLGAIDAGSVRWNGREITDRAAFFVPPQCAYVAQVPRLFAEPLGDNLRLGHDLDEADVLAGIGLAAFDDDVADLPDGLDTLVGARGVRLSGGQAQRAAGARAMAHRPELLVLDDLTSALDVDTELAVWGRLSAAGFTVLAASNRPAALARADRVVCLGDGG
ncbi:MAG: ABC transporter ATP-binding protein [Actinomycetota bacterium]|nr:ABC transporter ATP-binding protein [Actinomycetota bacterium]